jgi:hypothetical protein
VPTCFACGSPADYVGFLQVDGCTNQRCRFYKPKKFDFMQALEKAFGERFFGFYSGEPEFGADLSACLASIQIPQDKLKINALTCTIEGNHTTPVDPQHVGKRIDWMVLHDGHTILFKWPLGHQWFVPSADGEIEILGPIVLSF